MKKRMLSTLLTLCMVLTMVPVAFAADDSPIPIEYLPEVRQLSFDEENGTATISYSMKHSEENIDHYTNGYRALIWGSNGSRNSVFSGYLIDDEDVGKTAGNQKLKQELRIAFYDEPANGYTPIQSSVVGFFYTEPLYTQDTGYGIDVTLTDALPIPDGIEFSLISTHVYGTTIGTGFEKGIYYLQTRYENGLSFTATGTVTGPDDTLYVQGTTTGDIYSWAGRNPSIANASEVYFWHSTCTGLSADGKTANFEVTKKQALSPEAPPAENEPEIIVEEAAPTIMVSETGISEADKAALQAVIDNTEITGVTDALDESSMEQIIQSAGIDTDNAAEITVQIQVALTVTAADLQAGTISFEAVPTAVVTVDGVQSDPIVINNSYFNGNAIAVTLPVPAGFEPVEILHISDGQPIEQYLLANGDFLLVGNKATLTITHFSELQMNVNTTTVAKIDGSDTGYFSLQSAVNAADSGDTISLYRNSDDTVIRVANKSLTIDCNTYVIRDDVDWQLTGCTKSESTDDEGHQIITITRTSSGGGSSSGGGGSGSPSTGNTPSASVSGTGGNVSASDNGTVTITPDEGYQIGSITVNGEQVAIPSDGILTGLDSDDEVVVTFERITGDTGLPFVDVAAASWYADAVQYVYENGMMNGISETMFSPDATTTRAMIVTILHRLEGAPAADASGFTDVVAGSYYADAVAWAAENSIVNGISETSFAPNDPITREQMAAILYRYAQYKSYDVTASTDLNAYTDATQISSYAAAAMQWANAEGLITGNTATTINPAGNATRAEVATILMRFCENIG